MENEVTREQAEKFMETFRECSREGSCCNCKDCPYNYSERHYCFEPYYDYVGGEIDHILIEGVDD